MDDLISLIIFLVFVIASVASSIANKAKERRKAEEKRTRRPVRPEDLPPETRRQLYGGGGVRRAQPRSVPPGPSGTEIEWTEEGLDDEGAAPPRPATPVPRPVVMRGGGPPVITRTPGPEQVEYELERRREEARRRREEEERRRELEEARRRLEQERRMRLEQARRQAARRAEAPPPAAERRPRERMVEMPSPEMAAGPVPPIEQALRRRVPSERAAAGRFFSSRDDLRRAIILREILGPPKALDDPFPAPEARI